MSDLTPEVESSAVSALDRDHHKLANDATILRLTSSAKNEPSEVFETSLVVEKLDHFSIHYCLLRFGTVRTTAAFFAVDQLP